jgi:hypothetical protein
MKEKNENLKFSKSYKNIKTQDISRKKNKPNKNHKNQRKTISRLSRYK